jgi:hypothetical protein
MWGRMRRWRNAMLQMGMRCCWIACHPSDQVRAAGTRRANRNISHLVAKFLPFCDENGSCPPWEFFRTLCCLYSKMTVFDFFHIQGLHIFAGTLSDFRRSARRVGWPISRFLVSGPQVHFVYLTVVTVLLLLIFLSLRISLIPLTYVHPGFAIELLHCDNSYSLWIPQ